MRKILIVLILCLFILSGCNKKKKEESSPLKVPLKYRRAMRKTTKILKAMDDILYLKNKINTFKIQEGRYPKSLEELVEKGYIEKLPSPPEEIEFIYDPKTGSISGKVRRE
ncbi:MAG: hypothetical protein NC833_01425 [Candidatus Omnitrophica bacterium]|nr:hypothetical protein [Candidatus Omnitrophota bacterium]